MSKESRIRTFYPAEKKEDTIALGKFKGYKITVEKTYHISQWSCTKRIHKPKAFPFFLLPVKWKRLYPWDIAGFARAVSRQAWPCCPKPYPKQPFEGSNGLSTLAKTDSSIKRLSSISTPTVDICTSAWLTDGLYSDLPEKKQSQNSLQVVIKKNSTCRGSGKTFNTKLGYRNDLEQMEQSS